MDRCHRVRRVFPEGEPLQDYVPSRPLHVNSAKKVTGREMSSGFEVEPDLALVEL
jgi:hypothetical protein